MSDPMTSEVLGTADVSSSVTAEEIRQNVDADKSRAMEAIKKASEELSSFKRFEFKTDITGEPHIAATYNRYDAVASSRHTAVHFARCLSP